MKGANKMVKLEMINRETDEIMQVYLYQTREVAYNEAQVRKDNYIGYRVSDFITDETLEYEV
jgi:hypothetical protein